MRLIAGLGNPGSRYDGTRHNVGFMVVESLAASLRSPFRPGKGEFAIALARVGASDVAIVKPTTFMNESGTAVREAMDLFGIPLSNALIVYDDFHLPLGTIRFRTGGSDGGHNGIASVLFHAGTDEIPRLRCGIGQPDRDLDDDPTIDFVLSPFDDSELPSVRGMITRATEGIRTYATRGMQAAMNEYNRPPDHSG